MDERSFYSESRTTRSQDLNCPYCKSTQTYDLEWLVRLKKDRLPGNADERDRARFAKAQSYMVLLDDKVGCKNLDCRKRIEVSGIKTTAFLNAEQEEAIRGAGKQQANAKQPDRNRRTVQQKKPKQWQGQKQGQKQSPKQGQKQGQKQKKSQKQNDSFGNRIGDDWNQSGQPEWQGNYATGNRQPGARKGGAKKKRPKYIGVYQRPAPGREY